MHKIYYEEYNTKCYNVRVTYYIFADNSVYRREELYLDGVCVRSLLCKALNKVDDYKEWDNNYYIKKGKVFFKPVIRKATDTLDYMKVDNGEYEVSFEPNTNLIYTLRSVSEHGLEQCF